MISFDRRVLKNNLRVILAPMCGIESVSLLVLIKTGSRNEDKSLGGISHFLEHLFFKGTKKRPLPGQVAKDLDAMGSRVDAFTNKETTGFWVKSSLKDFDKTLEIIADILLNPIFKKEEIEKERGVILQELSMYEDDPPRRVAEYLENIMFEGNPIGLDIGGTKETVARITRKDIIGHKNNNYLSENMIISIAGNIKKEEALKKIKKAFEKVRKGNRKPNQKTITSQESPNLKIKEKDTDQTHFALGVRAYDMMDERKYAVDLLGVILGGNMSSKLFSEIREKLGLAYYVYAYNDKASDCGYLGIGAGIPADKLEIVMTKIMKTCGDIKRSGVTEKDLSRAKGFLRGRFALDFEDSESVATFLAKQELFYGKVEQPQDILRKIEKVTRGDILKVARDIFRPENINMAVIGRNKDTQENRELFKKIFSQI